MFFFFFLFLVFVWARFDKDIWWEGEVKKNNNIETTISDYLIK